jgi:hypothetical protein
MWYLRGMPRAYAGRALAIAGIVTGLLAVGLEYVPGERHVDDGTTAAFLIVLLCFASWLPAEIGRDAVGAACGAAAFGFFLFFPAVAAFSRLGGLDCASWLGLCTLLIPIGALLTSTGTASRRERPPLGGDVGAAIALLGVVLLVVGIWLHVASEAGATYWNVSGSGHAVGILMLLLAALNVLVLAAPVPALSRVDLMLAASTFGFVETGLVVTAFGQLGSLGAGAWVEACAGVLLLGGVVRRSR